MAAISTVQDTFPGTTLNAIWAASDANASVNNGLTIAHPASSTAYSNIYTPTYYDATSSYSLSWMTSAGNQALVSYQVYPLILFAGTGTDSNANVSFILNQNNLSANIDDGTSSAQYGTIPYSAGLHRYFKIEESGGTTYWYTSPDGQHFSELYSVANPITMTSLRVLTMVGSYNAEATSTSATWAEVGYFGPVGPPIKLSQSVTRAAYY